MPVDPEADRLERAGAVARGCYRVALRLYPHSFYRHYADDLDADFADATEEALRRGDACGVLSSWAAAFADLPLSLLREWLRTPWPAAIVLGGIVAVSALYATIIRTHRPLQSYRRQVTAMASPPEWPQLLSLFVLIVLIPVAVSILTIAVSRLTRRRPGRSSYV